MHVYSSTKCRLAINLVSLSRMLSPAFFAAGGAAVLCGPPDCTGTVAFRLASEQAASGGRVLTLRRDQRGSEQLRMPQIAKIVGKDMVPVQDSFCWRIAELRSMDDVYVNNSHELKTAIAMVPTLQHLPDMLIIENLSEIIDPLYAADHSEFDFLNQALMIRCFLDDTAMALQSIGGNRPTVVITDCTAADSSYARIIGRGGSAIGVVSRDAGTASGPVSRPGADMMLRISAPRTHVLTEITDEFSSITFSFRVYDYFLGIAKSTTEVEY